MRKINPKSSDIDSLKYSIEIEDIWIKEANQILNKSNIIVKSLLDMEMLH